MPSKTKRHARGPRAETPSKKKQRARASSAGTASTKTRHPPGSRAKVPSKQKTDARETGVDVATGAQDAQLHADLSTDELEAELERAAAPGLESHDARTPRLPGGDVEAAWDVAAVGDETVGGAAPTPDQDQVDALGEAVGITYGDSEPLRPAEKVAERDDQRWELDPASAEDYEPRQRELAQPAPPTRPRAGGAGSAPARRVSGRSAPRSRR